MISLVMAMGIMKFLPESTAVPLFSNDEAARQFFDKHSISLPANTPVLLFSGSCQSCAALKAQLSGAGITFIEQDSVQQPSALPLLEAAKTATGSAQLPKVIVRNQVIKADLQAIRAALKG
jgi:glutaredoxin